MNGWVRTRSAAVEAHFRLECRGQFLEQVPTRHLRPSSIDSPPPHKDFVRQEVQGPGDSKWHLLPLTRYLALCSELCSTKALNPQEAPRRQALPGPPRRREGNRLRGILLKASQSRRRARGLNLGSVRPDSVQVLHHRVVCSIQFAKEETETQRGEAIARGPGSGLAERERGQVQCLSSPGVLLRGAGQGRSSCASGPGGKPLLR